MSRRPSRAAYAANATRIATPSEPTRRSRPRFVAARASWSSIAWVGAARVSDGSLPASVARAESRAARSASTDHGWMSSVRSGAVQKDSRPVVAAPGAAAAARTPFTSRKAGGTSRAAVGWSVSRPGICGPRSSSWLSGIVVARVPRPTIRTWSEPMRTLAGRSAGVAATDRRMASQVAPTVPAQGAGSWPSVSVTALVGSSTATSCRSYGAAGSRTDRRMTPRWTGPINPVAGAKAASA